MGTGSGGPGMAGGSGCPRTQAIKGGIDQPGNVPKMYLLKHYCETVFLLL
jgi:hypothetical protein